MDRIFIFDVDGTLTPSRLPMTKEFQKFFKQWIKKNKFYLVTGSDLPKLQEQICFYDIEAEGIFTCCGNQFWKPDPSIVNTSAELIYDNKFEMTNKLKSSLEVMLMSSQYPHRYGNHIEDRGSMVNFSVVGRNCTQEQREKYYEWDKEKGERRKMSIFLRLIDLSIYVFPSFSFIFNMLLLKDITSPVFDIPFTLYDTLSVT